MKRWFLSHWKDLLFSVVVTFFFTLPWITRDFVGIEHDTYFHFSRITGLADALKRGDFFPAIYPYKNNGFGYASPLFYCDFFLVIPAFFYNLGLSLAGSYKLLMIGTTFFTAFSITCTLHRFSKSQIVVWIVSFAYVFSNYRITDFYVRSAVGEVMAFTFLPIVVSGLYDVLELKKDNWLLLSFGLAGLIMCHNLTFLFGAVIVVIFALVYLKGMDGRIFCNLCKAALTAFLVTSWFTLPMIEQISSQKFILNYYAEYSDLSESALPLWKYFANQTVFGMASNTLPKEKSMLLNIGYFLMLAPVLWLFQKKEDKKKQKFAAWCLIFGYTAMIMPSQLLPWKNLTFLRVLQFPWRLMTIAMVLLTVPACTALESFSKISRQKAPLIILSALLLIEGFWHLAPVYTRTFGITSKNTYQDILDGKFSDPYYSADYMRVELAGGDYLPLNHPDFRTLQSLPMNTKRQYLNVPVNQNGTVYTVTLSEGNQDIILPITWYKGYHVYKVIEGKKVEVNSWSSSEALVAFHADEKGTYVCEYHNTIIRNASLFLSAAASIYVLFLIHKCDSISTFHHKFFFS